MLRISTPKDEGTLRVSKALKHQVLLEANEMAALFDELADFSIFVVSEPVTREEAEMSKRDFLSTYALYVQSLKEGRVLDDRVIRKAFSSIWTVDSSLVYAMPVAGEKFLIKALRPVLQLQLHRFVLSEVDEKVHPLVLGPGSISWGVQFSYPQVYQDPQTEEIAKVPRDFPNSQLYWKLSRWLRNQTLPTPFLFNEKRIVSSLRLGKECMGWIDEYLKPRGIQCALK